VLNRRPQLNHRHSAALPSRQDRSSSRGRWASSHIRALRDRLRSAPGWWDAGAGYQSWGCHLNVSAPLVNTAKGSFTFVAAEFDGSYWNDFSPVRLRHGSTEASFTTRGVFAPTERVYGARVTLFRGKTQVAQNQTVLTTPLVCPEQTP
jgi:hypothetical protein